MLKQKNSLHLKVIIKFSSPIFTLEGLCFLCRGVRERTSEDQADAAAFPFDEAAEMQSLGALGPHGEEGYSTLERRLGFRFQILCLTII